MFCKEDNQCIWSIFSVEPLKEIDDSLCVACKNKLNEERVVLFLKMANGYK